MSFFFLAHPVHTELDRLLKYLNPISVFIFNGKIYSLCQNNSISKKNF